MRTFLRRLFARKPLASRQAARKPAPLGVERLDERLLLSASPFLMQGATTSIAGTGVSATLSGSTLFVQDRGSGETVQVLKSGLQLRVQVTEADGSAHAASSMPLMPVSVSQVQFEAPGRQDSFSNLLGTPSSFKDDYISASYSTGTHALSVPPRLGGSDGVSVSTLSGSQAMYSAQSGSWFLPGGPIGSLVHGGSSLSVQGGDSTYLLHQSSAGDSVATLSVSPQDAGLRKVFVQDATRDYIASGGLTRSDMLDLFTQAGKDGTVSAQELTDLRALVGSTSVSMPADVRDLAGKVVNGDPANSNPNTTGAMAPGNLQAGSSSTVLADLVSKWFQGNDLPTLEFGSYSTISGPLFSSAGPVSTDVAQGSDGDCYLLAGLAEVAKVDPQAIKDMFHDNGDGTFSVRFFRWDSTGTTLQADYVTVNSQLGVYNEGGGMYDYVNADRNQTLTPTAQGFSTSGPLWVGLAEKAYAQVMQEGWLGNTAVYANSYDTISGGDPGSAVEQITGLSGCYASFGADGQSQRSQYVPTAAAFLQSQVSGGAFVTLAAYSGDAADGIVGSHAYAVTGYDAGTGLYTVYNPWGSSQQMTATQIANDFAVVESVVLPGSAVAAADNDWATRQAQGIWKYNGANGSWTSDYSAAPGAAGASAVTQAAALGVSGPQGASTGQQTLVQGAELVGHGYADAAFAGLEGSSYWDLVSHHQQHPAA